MERSRRRRLDLLGAFLFIAWQSTLRGQSSISGQEATTLIHWLLVGDRSASKANVVVKKMAIPTNPRKGTAAPPYHETALPVLARHGVGQ
jgi:hypothetical protein